MDLRKNKEAFFKTVLRILLIFLESQDILRVRCIYTGIALGCDHHTKEEGAYQ